MLYYSITMLFELVKLALRRKYTEFNNLLKESDFDLKSSVEITLLDLLEDENVRDIMFLRVIKDESITPDNCILTLKKLFDAKVDVNCKDKEGKTFLHYSRDESVTKFLIDMNANVNELDKMNRSPLHFSTLINKNSVKLLIENKAQVNVKNKHGNTPLHVCKDLSMAKLLVENKAQINARGENGNTPLHVCRDLSMAKLFVENKADVNIRNNDGNTPLNYVYEEHYFEFAKLFLENKLNVNYINNRGNAVIHSLVDEKYYDVVKLFIEHRADVNIRGNYGYTPLYYCRSAKVVRMLIKAKANINFRDQFGKTFLESYFRYSNVEILQVLLEEGLIFKIIDNTKITPELFKEHTKFIMKCILNYDNEVQNVINLMV